MLVLKFWICTGCKDYQQQQRGSSADNISFVLSADNQRRPSPNSQKSSPSLLIPSYLTVSRRRCCWWRWWWPDTCCPSATCEDAILTPLPAGKNEHAGATMHDKRMQVDNTTSFIMSPVGCFLCLSLFRAAAVGAGAPELGAGCWVLELAVLLLREIRWRVLSGAPFPIAPARPARCCHLLSRHTTTHTSVISWAALGELASRCCLRSSQVRPSAAGSEKSPTCVARVRHHPPSLL